MKRIIYLLIFTAFTSVVACKKSNTDNNGGISSLNIVHACIGAPSMYVYFTYTDSNYYLQQSSLAYGASEVYSVPGGPNMLSFISTDDTVKPYYQTTINLAS